MLETQKPKAEQLLSPKARAPSVKPDYEWAIKTFYFSAKKLSLRGAYEMMLLQRYIDHQGQLAPTRPTFCSFRAYFYSRNYHKSPRKIIARDGLSHYQRNCQPAFGTASVWRKSSGSFQMDATEADIYLLSDSGAPFRPYIYLAVDSATQLIAGVWVGESCDEMSVMRCLENCVQDKTEWCGRHGITITPEQWPSHGLPSSASGCGCERAAISRNVNPYENHASFSIGMFQAGNKFNVIPDTAVFEGALRFTDITRKDYLWGRVCDTINGIAQAGGCTAKITYNWTPANNNDPALIEKMVPRLCETLGEDRVVVLDVYNVLDDYAFFQELAPGIMGSISTAPEEAPADGSSVPGLQSAKMTVNERGLKEGVKALAAFALKFAN